MKEYICALSGMADSVAMVIAVITWADKEHTQMIDWSAYIGGTYLDPDYDEEKMMRRVGDRGSKLGEFGAMQFFGPDTAYNLPMGKYRA